MLVPGVIINSGRILVAAGAGQTPNFLNQGVGFMTNGPVAIDTNAPAGNAYLAGIRRSAAGAIYGTTALDSSGPDVFLHGLRLSRVGVLVCADSAPNNYQNGNPQTANGALAVNTA